jgi:hypothetical protein
MEGTETRAHSTRLSDRMVSRTHWSFGTTAIDIRRRGNPINLQIETT